MKTVVTGGSGQVGRALKDLMPEWIYLSSKDYDLTDQNQVIDMYHDHTPERVIHLAARVGGILDNIEYPSEYLVDNIQMNTLLTKYAKAYNIKRFTGIISTCAYPDEVEHYPMQEHMLDSGPPAETNFNYSYAKRVQALQIDSYNEQYGTKYNYLIPCNLYSHHSGTLSKLHFIQALIKKIKIAQHKNKDTITLLGTGKPLRQFLYAPDLAAVIALMAHNDITASFNVASPENLSIATMADIVMKTMGVDFNIKWDRTQPDGQYRRDVCLIKFRKYFPSFKFTSLEDGVLDIMYHDFLS